MTENLCGFTIFEDPSDCPGHYVLRGWEVDDDGHVVRLENAIATPVSDVALESLRDTMREMGLACFARSPTDDPVIVETWM
jgi:hypothetical protein